MKIRMYLVGATFTLLGILVCVVAAAFTLASVFGTSSWPKAIWLIVAGIWLLVVGGVLNVASRGEEGARLFHPFEEDTQPEPPSETHNVYVTNGSTVFVPDCSEDYARANPWIIADIHGHAVDRFPSKLIATRMLANYNNRKYFSVKSAPEPVQVSRLFDAQ